MVNVKQYDAFTTVPGKGNPAGVVLAAIGLSDTEMQYIAAEAGYNETAFVLPSEKADYRFRYFTPGHEMNLCGHGTIACIQALVDAGWITAGTITIDTNAGLLPIVVDLAGEEPMITMRQAIPQFLPWTGDSAALLAAIGLTIEDLDTRYPIVYGNTGIWTLLIPIKERRRFAAMQSDNPLFPALLAEVPRASVHPFTLDTQSADTKMYGRHFSSPYSGTIEDPVTGTASGVMGAYYKTYIQPDLKTPACLTIEQGHEIGKAGKVYVHVEALPELSIAISGTAIYVKDVSLKNM
ncbi:hypothetical protein A5886_002602 [Enterococcus sp. 8G7_MSG3316]|uniref:PhzF family phenazine biosynthesis protein n=1 Tax=Candidatus Enterococcus testudinis TaxID=1834191 RepID=A0A242A976_9ENTE|nr:PhzF family phenazine biosynthesis isomerase [Enterococcus sp. 8G7_MSG3316]OTN77502.1 hypothetical protein A5886_002602 [Enterococcus sp. 8G7_MSG3316]